MSPKYLLALSLVSAGLAFSEVSLRADDAQAQLPVPPPPAAGTPPADGQTPPAGGHRHGRRPATLAELTLKLSLTADQQKTIGPIIATARDQAKDLRGDDSLSREDKHAKMKEIENTSRTQIRAALTADQQKIFDGMGHEAKPAAQSPDTVPSAPAPNP